MKPTEKITLRVTLEQKQQLDEIRDQLHLLSVSEVMRRLISDGYDKHVFNYKTIAQKRVPRPNQTPEEKAQAKLEDKQAEQELRKKQTEAKYMGICKALEGEVTEKDGKKSCTYMRYQEMAGGQIQEYPDTVPFSQMNEEMLDVQYLGLFGEKGNVAKAKIRKMLSNK